MRVSVRVSRVAKANHQCLLLYVNNNKFFDKKGNTDHIQAASFSKRFSIGRGLKYTANFLDNHWGKVLEELTAGEEFHEN